MEKFNLLFSPGDNTTQEYIESTNTCNNILIVNLRLSLRISSIKPQIKPQTQKCKLSFQRRLALKDIETAPLSLTARPLCLGPSLALIATPAPVRHDFASAVRMYWWAGLQGWYILVLVVIAV